MTGPVAVSIVAAALAAASTEHCVRAWRRRRRGVAVLSALAGGACALVAMRDLPAPLIVALLVTGLVAIAAVTAWPLLPLGRRASARPGRAGRRGDGS